MSKVLNIFDSKEVLKVGVINEDGEIAEKEITIQKVDGMKALQGIARLFAEVDFSNFLNEDGTPDMSSLRFVLIGAVDSLPSILSSFVNHDFNKEKVANIEDIIEITMTVFDVNELDQVVKNLMSSPRLRKLVMTLAKGMKK